MNFALVIMFITFLVLLLSFTLAAGVCAEGSAPAA